MNFQTDFFLLELRYSSFNWCLICNSVESITERMEPNYYNHCFSMHTILGFFAYLNFLWHLIKLVAKVCQNWNLDHKVSNTFVQEIGIVRSAALSGAGGVSADLCRNFLVFEGFTKIEITRSFFIAQKLFTYRWKVEDLSYKKKKSVWKSINFWLRY